MGILAVGGLQIALGALRWLLHRARRDRLRSREALKGIHVLTIGVLGAAALRLLTMLPLLVVVGVGGPGIVLGALVCLATAVAATLLLRAGRRALHSAMVHRAEPAAVL